MSISTPAKSLNGHHIGSVVRFATHNARGLRMEIVAELRQIYHTSSEVIVNVISPDETHGDLDEFRLDLDTRIQEVPND